MLHTLHVQNSRFSACLRVVHKAEAAITCHHTQLGAMLKVLLELSGQFPVWHTLDSLFGLLGDTHVNVNFHAKYELRASDIRTYRFKIHMGHLRTCWISCVFPRVAISKFLSQRRDGGWEPVQWLAVSLEGQCNSQRLARPRENRFLPKDLHFCWMQVSPHFAAANDL